MSDIAVQDYYIDEFAHCFGCGRLNKDGMQIKSYWNGKECVCHYTPKPYYTAAFPDFLWRAHQFVNRLPWRRHGIGGKASGRGLHPARPRSFTFVTASLKVDYLKPTPIGKVLELKGRPKESLTGKSSWPSHYLPKARSVRKAKRLW